MAPTMRVMLYCPHLFKGHTLFKDYTVSRSTGEGWIRLKGNADIVPTGAAAAKYDDQAEPAQFFLPEGFSGPT